MSFILAESQDGSVPRVVERALAAGASFARGALCLIDASGNIAECGADPVAIAGVAESGAGTDTNLFNPLRSMGFPPGKMQLTCIRGQVFRAKYTGALPAADGGVYGVVLHNGEWKVDFTDTTATRVKLVGRLTDSPENQPFVKVRFLDANVQDI